MTRAVIALGANLGDPVAALVDAVAALRATPGIQVVAVSGLWRTRAVGGPLQPDYCNAVVLVDTELPPLAVLAACQQLEADAGRERLVRWGPRTLDLDVIDIEGVTSTDPTLTLPHPRAHERAFVLAPWDQVSPEWELIAQGRRAPVHEWLAGMTGQVVALDPDPSWWRRR